MSAGDTIHASNAPQAAPVPADIGSKASIPAIPNTDSGAPKTAARAKPPMLPNKVHEVRVDGSQDEPRTRQMRPAAIAPAGMPTGTVTSKPHTVASNTSVLPSTSSRRADMPSIGPAPPLMESLRELQPSAIVAAKKEPPMMQTARLLAKRAAKGGVVPSLEPARPLSLMSLKGRPRPRQICACPHDYSKCYEHRGGAFEPRRHSWIDSTIEDHPEITAPMVQGAH